MIVTAEQAAIMAGEAIAAGKAFIALPMVGAHEYNVHTATDTRSLLRVLNPNVLREPQG